MTQLPSHAATAKRDGVSFHSDCIPPPGHAGRSGATAVRPAARSDPNFLTYSARRSTRSCPLNAFALVTGLRPQNHDDSQNGPIRYPRQVYEKGLRPRFRRSEALSHTWWQVKDSNLRSFRDGFTDHRRQARDQRQCLSPTKLPGVFPTDSRRQPTSAVANRTRNRLPSRRLLTGQTGLLVRNQVPT